MDKRAVLDVSCLMLFEASGDSEIDGVDDATVGSFEEDEDDAESCSYESSDWKCIKKIENDSDQRVDIFCLKDDEEVENDGNHGEVEDVVEQYYCGNYKAAEVVVPPPRPPNASEESEVAEKFKKPKVCDDPDTKMMNQRDKDRLFWEACLAS
ncbi:Hypothetical predicted protein [Olea europaea subsp. europaea]|uniref:Uncharacterized protein n=1 Tax=Olea europaea subsp. europaea TaxID=158383 RepID=A0A8S0R322_OLEEU|nr:Hypothetical predicted protein [Olea europaea subsp. europaea]